MLDVKISMTDKKKIIFRIRMDRGKEFKATFSNLLVTGPSNFKIEKLKVNLDNGTFNFIISLPKLEFTGKYTLKMRILGE